MLEFQSFSKIPRLFKPMTITEKIDGTNAQVVITNRSALDDQDKVRADKLGLWLGKVGDEWYTVLAGSRNRYLELGKDNFGFAKWVFDNAEALVSSLGAGKHFGEWFGAGIQRGYGANGKKFALFNVGKWGHFEYCPNPIDFLGVPGLTVVPTLLEESEFNLGMVEAVHADLMDTGSRAVRGFDKPEGVMVFHQAAGQLFKYTDDPRPKGVAELDEILAETNRILPEDYDEYAR